MSHKKFLDLDGLKTYHNKISAKIKELAFSGSYEDLSDKPTIQTITVDEEEETIIIS